MGSKIDLRLLSKTSVLACVLCLGALGKNDVGSSSLCGQSGVGDPQCKIPAETDTVAAEGFELSAACAARQVDSIRDLAGVEDLMKECPSHCAARLVVARAQPSRLQTLTVLSPRWNARGGDPLLSWPLGDVLSTSMRRACVDLVRELANGVLTEARNSERNRKNLLKRATAYFFWVHEHDPIPMDFLMQLNKELSAVPLERTNMAELEFWRRQSLLFQAGVSPGGAAVNLTVKHVSHDPPLLMIDGVLSETDCADIIEWMDRETKRVRPQYLCFDDPRAGMQFASLSSPRAFHIRNAQQSCLDPEISSRLLSKLAYVNDFQVYEGMGADGPPFAHHVKEPLAKIDRFLINVLGLPDDHAGMQHAVTYPAGATFGKHVDCSSTTRQITTLMYLSTMSKDDGGATNFWKLKKKVSPRCGRLLVFLNQMPDGSCDPKTLHEASLVRNGTKRILQRWYHVEPSVMDKFRNPGPVHVPSYKPFGKIVNCADRLTALQHGQDPKQCRENQPDPDFQRASF